MASVTLTRCRSFTAIRAETASSAYKEDMLPGLLVADLVG